MEVGRDWVIRRLYERLSFLNRQLTSTIRERAVASDSPSDAHPSRAVGGEAARAVGAGALDDAMPFPGTDVAVLGKAYEEHPSAPAARVQRHRAEAEARLASSKARRIGARQRATEGRDAANRNREIARRLSELNHQIIEHTQSINDVRRAIVRRKEERKAQLKEARKMINRKLPSDFWAAKELNYARFVTLHADLFRSAINLANDCEEVFPDHQRDFKKLPLRQRDKLFTKIKEILMS